MAFHSCDEEVFDDCSDPSYHKIYLAGSDDGDTWLPIKDFKGVSGSVPDIVFFNDYLYIFHTASFMWEKVDKCFDIVDSGDVELTSEEDSTLVDPSLIVNGDSLEMFYLPGVEGSDPARCESYPCTKEIHSAYSDEEDVASFIQISGNRASLTLDAGAFSDPDIIELSDGSFLLYVSRGQNTYVYSSDKLSEAFELESESASDGSGGVPSAITISSDEVWLYVTTNNEGTQIIQKATSSDGIEFGDFSQVLDYSILKDVSELTDVASPSIIDWPGSSWK